MWSTAHPIPLIHDDVRPQIKCLNAEIGQVEELHAAVRHALGKLFRVGKMLDGKILLNAELARLGGLLLQTSFPGSIMMHILGSITECV